MQQKNAFNICKNRMNYRPKNCNEKWKTSQFFIRGRKKSVHIRKT